METPIKTYRFEDEYGDFINNRGKNASHGVESFREDIINHALISSAVGPLESMTEMSLFTPEEALTRASKGLNKALAFVDNIPSQYLNEDSKKLKDDIVIKLERLIDNLQQIYKVKDKISTEELRAQVRVVTEEIKEISREIFSINLISQE